MMDKSVGDLLELRGLVPGDSGVSESVVRAESLEKFVNTYLFVQNARVT